MRKVFLATVAAATLFTASVAHADYYRNRGHYHGGGGYRGGWAAPLIGGLIVGGLVGGAIASEPRYYPEPRYYSPYPAYRTECRIVHDIDRWGNYMGDRRECYQVPAY